MRYFPQQTLCLPVALRDLPGGCLSNKEKSGSSILLYSNINPPATSILQNLRGRGYDGINAIIKSYPSITCAINSNLQNPDALHIPWSWKPSPEGTAYTVQARGSHHSRPLPDVEKHVPLEQPASACGGEACYPAVHMLGKAKQTYIRHHKTLNYVRMSICPFWGSHQYSQSPTFPEY